LEGAGGSVLPDSVEKGEEVVAEGGLRYRVGLWVLMGEEKLVGGMLSGGLLLGFQLVGASLNEAWDVQWGARHCKGVSAGRADPVSIV
jgi:hypothetical protein